MEPISLQCTIGGLSANATTGGDTLFAALDIVTGTLLVDLSETVRNGMPELRRPGCAVVTNNAACEDYDALFTEADMRAAISDYFAFAGRGLLVLDDSQARHSPASKIAPDGVDETGIKYRVAPDITNGQLAIVVLCWFALKQAGFARQLAAFDTGVDMNITTVGIPGAFAPSAGRDIVRYEMGGALPIGRDGWPL